HGLAIQFGTGMLDIAVAYLGLAFFDSLERGLYALAGIEFAFFFWSKPFMPAQMILVALGLLGIVILGSAAGLHWDGFDREIGWGKFFDFFFIVSLICAGPFLAKSISYAGTPLFPFAPFALGGKLSASPAVKEAVLGAAADLRQARDAYGLGRGWGPF